MRWYVARVIDLRSGGHIPGDLAQTARPGAWRHGGRGVVHGVVLAVFLYRGRHSGPRHDGVLVPTRISRPLTGEFSLPPVAPALAPAASRGVGTQQTERLRHKGNPRPPHCVLPEWVIIA